jgi:hypothetical protein
MDVTNMPKDIDKNKHRDTIRAARILRTAKITGVSTRHVRRVCEGEYTNDAVLETMVRLTQMENHIDNELLKEVKKLVSL